jgi:hypothetical protein
VAEEVMAELGGDHPLVPVAAPGERVADEGLGGVVAVTLGGVDEVDAEVGGAVDDPVRLALREVLRPLPAELPRPQPDDRDAQVGAAEPAVFHGGRIWRRRAVVPSSPCSGERSDFRFEI